MVEVVIYLGRVIDLHAEQLSDWSHILIKALLLVEREYILTLNA